MALMDVNANSILLLTIKVLSLVYWINCFRYKGDTGGVGAVLSEI